MSLTNSSLHLSQYDDLYVQIYLPTILYLAGLMLLGIVGNTGVCVIYSTKFKPSTTRCFIITMGILDLLNCSVSIPLQILELRYITRFGRFGLCQVLIMCVTFFSMASAAVLLAVAVDRYRKICRHYLKQLTPHTAKLVCILCCVVTCVFSLPTTVIYGSGTLLLDQLNATVCLITDEDSGQLYHLVYTGLQMVIFIVSSAVLITLYSLIWRQVRRQQVVRRRLSQSSNSDKNKWTVSKSDGHIGGSTPTSSTMCSCFSSSNSTNLNGNKNTVSIEYNKKGELVNMKMPHNNDLYHSDNADTAERLARDKNNTRDESTHSSSRLNARKYSDLVDGQRRNTKIAERHGSRRVTFIFFMITLVFIVSYLPYLAIMAANAVDDTVLNNTAALSAILERSYFLQSVSNPIIYSFFNANFRHQLKRIFLKNRL